MFYIIEKAPAGFKWLIYWFTLLHNQPVCEKPFLKFFQQKKYFMLTWSDIAYLLNDFVHLISLWFRKPFKMLLKDFHPDFTFNLINIQYFARGVVWDFNCVTKRSPNAILTISKIPDSTIHVCAHTCMHTHDVCL